MQITLGTICRLLHNSASEVNGFSLDTGLNVRFPSDWTTRVLAIVTAGSQVAIHVGIRRSVVGADCVDATFITNLDSGQSIDLSATLPPNSPEVSTGVYASPRRETPLAPASETVRGLQHSATAKDVADEIEQAYDRLHRTQAMLAYLAMMKQGKSIVGEYLEEAKHTYIQALSCHQARDFEGAREFAAASNGLSRVVEILVSRTFHSNISYPKLVPPPPEHAYAHRDREAAGRDLDGVEQLLARVHWVTENGTMAPEERAQVTKLSSWCDRLYRWARRLLETGAMEDAIEFVQAAHAAACSADHLCRKCYVTRSANPRPAVASS